MEKALDLTVHLLGVRKCFVEIRDKQCGALTVFVAECVSVSPGAGECGSADVVPQADVGAQLPSKILLTQLDPGPRLVQELILLEQARVFFPGSLFRGIEESGDQIVL